jgi:hypothetical protein
MPLTGTEVALRDSIVANLGIDSDPNLNTVEKNIIKQAWLNVVSAEIPHLVSNILVGTTVAVVSVSGVTTGPGVSGPGAGTGTGTIT